jgi:dipeptidyl aminopeptidase/acylaminoacyl peptidase
MMPDLHGRLRWLDHVDAPDLWDEIADREGRPSMAPPPHRRMLAAMTAVVVAVLGLAVVWRVFLTDESRRVIAPDPSGLPANGEIWFRKGGGDGPSYVHIINPDGTGERELFGDGRDPQDQHVNPEAVGESYDWSADGTRLAFSDYATDVAGSSNWKIFVMSPDGVGRVQVTKGPGLDSDPAWSPDGARLAFARALEAEPEAGCWGSDLCPSDIYTTSLDGTSVVQLTENPADDSEPDWSPDGTRIAFKSSRDDPSGEIYVMRADGTGVSRLTADPGFQSTPVWSPDGSKIAFIGFHPGDPVDVFVMNADGTGITRLTDNIDNSFVQGLDWSPDGTKIAFSSDLRDSEVSLYVMNADGSGLTKLAIGAGDIAWRPIPPTTG